MVLLARQVIAAQLPDGSWAGDPRIETSYILLFLARGRHAIMMNKLRFSGYWANRPHDVANLSSRFASHEVERPLNWQVVPLEHDWTDWTDSPILYLASHKPVLSLNGIDVKKVRRVCSGRRIAVHAGGRGLAGVR